MLCAKTLKAAKAALVIILGAWATTSAHAAMNLSGATTHAPAVYAAETVSTKAFTDLVATNTTFDVVAWSDVSLSDATYHYRYDLSGSTGKVRFAGGSGITLMLGEDGTATPPARQRTSDLVFSVEGVVNRSTINAKGDVVKSAVSGEETTDLILNLNGAHPQNDADEDLVSAPRKARVQVQSAPSSGDYKFMLRLRIYSQLDAALSGGTSTLYDSGAKPIIVIDPTLSAEVKKSPDLVADVAHNFTRFEGGSEGMTSGTLATVEVKLDDMHCSTGTYNTDLSCKGTAWDIMAASKGTKIAIGDVLGSGALVVKGDLSLVDLKLGTSALTLRDALAKSLEKHKEGDNKGMYKDRSLAVDAHIALSAASKMNLTANVGPKNESAIPASSYTASVALTPKNSDAAPIAGITDAAAGMIVTNGTMVHLGYLTGHDGYNQRVIIANRGTVDARYVVSNILTEDGTEATGGKMATGMVSGGSQMVIKTNDLISFDSGMTRASATISLTAPKAAISVSTTIVNLGDGSTDTTSHMVQ